MKLVPQRKRLLQVSGMMLMIAGVLSLLEMIFVSVNFGPSGPPTLYIVWSWVRLIGSVLAIWGGKRLLSRGMALEADPVDLEEERREDA